SDVCSSDLYVSCSWRTSQVMRAHLSPGRPTTGAGAGDGDALGEAVASAPGAGVFWVAGASSPRSLTVVYGPTRMPENGSVSARASFIVIVSVPPRLEPAAGPVPVMRMARHEAFGSGQGSTSTF